MDKESRFKITVVGSPMDEGTSSEETPSRVGVPSALDNILSRHLAKISQEFDVDLEKVTRELEERLRQLDTLFHVIARNVSHMELSEVEVELNITSEGLVSVAPWGIGASGSLGAGGTLKLRFQPKESSEQTK